MAITVKIGSIEMLIEDAPDHGFTIDAEQELATRREFFAGCDGIAGINLSKPAESYSISQLSGMLGSMVARELIAARRVAAGQ